MPPRSPMVDTRRYIALHLVLIPLGLALIAWACQHTRLDMALTQLFVDPATDRFIWRDSTALEVLGHQAARSVPLMVAALAIAAGLAGFAMPALRPSTPILLTVGAAMLLGPLVVAVLKSMTAQHCPADLQVFGGVVDYVTERSGPFWASSRASAGHCLPSGHASGGYALLALYFAGWSAGRPRWRWRGLAIGIAAGLLFGIVRMMQGAQFPSATLWSAVVDWTVCAALFLPLLCAPKKRTA